MIMNLIYLNTKNLGKNLRYQMILCRKWYLQQIKKFLKKLVSVRTLLKQLRLRNIETKRRIKKYTDVCLCRVKHKGFALGFAVTSDLRIIDESSNSIECENTTYRY